MKIGQFWDDAIVPAITEYIRIPAKSPHFDRDWQKHGYIESALQLAVKWCRANPLQGMKLEVVRLDGRTPVLFIEIESTTRETVLIYGHLGFPALGVSGAAWATFVSRLYMLGVLAAAVWWYDRQRGRELRSREASGSRDHDEAGLWHVERTLHAARIRQLLMLGLPAASQVAAEVGVFALASALSGMLDPISSAAHQIALNLAGLAFMIPLGVGAAGAVRVGYWVGAREPARSAAAGWTAILLGTAFMLASGVLFVVFPRELIGLFTTDAGVVRVGTALLLLAALFQLFDGVQGVTTGTLRGLGDTRTPMLANLGAHWLLGLPISYTLVGSGNNFYGLYGDAGEQIKSITWYGYQPAGDGIASIKQVRLGGLQGAIPEPATWAMLLIGFGAIGATLRNKKSGAMRRMRIA